MEVEEVYMVKKLHYADYVRFLSVGSSESKGSVQGQIRVAQTKGSNQVLYGLATSSGSTNDELIVADLLLSYLVQANKSAFFKWRKDGGTIHRDSETWLDKAWPVRVINLFPYLIRSAHLIYPAELFSRPDKARKAWMLRFVEICRTATTINPALITSIGNATAVDVANIEDIQVEFSDLTYTKVATEQLPSDIVANSSLYRFLHKSKKKASIGFFANRAMLLHFKTANQAKSSPVEYLSLIKFLRLTGLPSYAEWKCAGVTGHRSSVATWFDQVISSPFQTYSMFSVELDYDGLQLKVTRLFDTQTEVEVDIDENNNEDK